MPNPTRQEILDAQLARQWAEQVQQSDAEYERKGRRYSGDPMRAAAEFILAHTDPPTMADVEWDDDKHYLAEAEHPDYGKVIMVYPSSRSEQVSVLFRSGGDVCQPWAFPHNLTPTGRRYTLTEVE